MKQYPGKVSALASRARCEYILKRESKVRVGALIFLLPLLLLPVSRLWAQQEKATALQQSLADNSKKLQQYRWVETTIINLDREEKSRIQNQCFYGPDGRVVKQPMGPSEQQSSHGLRGKLTAKKKADLTGYMQEAVGLVHQYVPPDSQRIKAAEAAGKISSNPGGPGVQLELRDYLKPGDRFSIGLNGTTNAINTLSVKSYLDSPTDAVALNVTFASLPDGASYPSQIVLSAPAKNLQVVVQNSNYVQLTAALQPTLAVDVLDSSGR
jgi:hypothetical protein